MNILSSESDEYERHFMPYHPEYTIMTNIDFDHPDYFEGIEDVTSAFQDYANNIKKGIFAYGEDVNLRKLTAKATYFTIMVLRLMTIIVPKIWSEVHVAHLLMLISAVKKLVILSFQLMVNTMY